MRENLSAHFKLREFRCPCCGQVQVSPALIRLLESIRAKIDEPLYVTSGFRCPKHNRKVGGEKDSKHLTGQAADIHARWISIPELYLIAVECNPDGGVGIYDTHVHVDVRQPEQTARWDRRKKTKKTKEQTA